MADKTGSGKEGSGKDGEEPLGKEGSLASTVRLSSIEDEEWLPETPEMEPASCSWLDGMHNNQSEKFEMEPGSHNAAPHVNGPPLKRCVAINSERATKKRKLDLSSNNNNVNNNDVNNNDVNNNDVNNQQQNGTNFSANFNARPVDDNWAAQDGYSKQFEMRY